MVYDLGKRSGQRLPRKKIKGKLIGISTDSERGGVVDADSGKYRWIRMDIVSLTEKVVINGEERDKVYFITGFGVDLEQMPELKKADDLLKQKIKPIVEVEYYETEVEATDQNGNIVMEEVEEIRDGKTVIIQRPKRFRNLRCSREDLLNTFKVIDESGTTQVFVGVTEERI